MPKFIKFKSWASSQEPQVFENKKKCQGLRLEWKFNDIVEL